MKVVKEVVKKNAKQPPMCEATLRMIVAEWREAGPSSRLSRLAMDLEQIIDADPTKNRTGRIKYIRSE